MDRSIRVLVAFIVPDVDITLRPAPRYDGVVKDPFRIEPGLHPFGTDFGNAEADQQLFQIDNTYHDYLRKKREARERRPELHYCEHRLSPAAHAAVCQHIVNHLAREHPDYFEVIRAHAQVTMHNRLNGACITFATGAHGLEWAPDRTLEAQFHSGLDALAHQIQEDLVVMSRNKDRHWMSAIHLCFPNHWCANDKIGRELAEVHQPVPHFERIAKMQSRFVDAMIERGPYVRFVWGLSFDAELDHHPQMIAQRAGFDPKDPQVFLRVERQCIAGLPAHDCALFTIRTYHYNLANQHSAMLARLHSAVASMDEHTLRYKGIGSSRKDLLNWLDARRSTANIYQAIHLRS